MRRKEKIDLFIGLSLFIGSLVVLCAFILALYMLGGLVLMWLLALFGVVMTFWKCVGIVFLARLLFVVITGRTFFNRRKKDIDYD